MDSYIRQIQSIKISPIKHEKFNMDCDIETVRSDTSKRKREDFGLEDIRIRVENLLGLANDLVNLNKSCPKIKPEEPKLVTNPEQSSNSTAPSRIPKRSQATPSSDHRPRSVTPQRVVKNRIQYYEALSQNKGVYKTVISQERELGIERTSIPISVNIKTTRRGFALNADRSEVPLFGEVTPTQDRSVFVFAAPTPVREIPRFVQGRNGSGSGSSQGVRKNIPLSQYNKETPSKIPILDKSKFFAAESTSSLNRKNG